MTRRRILILFAACGPVLAQRGPHRPPANAPKVELRGTIERVRIVRGEGMPFLELRDRNGTHRVLLGSMRYLIEKNFNPKAGAEAVVRGFQTTDMILAIRVELSSEKKSIQLRTEDGIPVWRGGGRR
jgi:hypothetical protein